jgi:hypothetical protein
VKWYPRARDAPIVRRVMEHMAKHGVGAADACRDLGLDRWFIKGVVNHRSLFLWVRLGGE